jgi:hypothetical protein
MVPRPERTERAPECVGPAKLAAERPRRLAVERPADDEARADHGVDGHQPPRGAVELNLDAPARPLVQRRDDG